jgi:dimethylglycine dehydrogenase
LIEAGKEFNIKPFGGRALMSMRLEKNWGAWTLDYRPDFTAKETGLDTFLLIGIKSLLVKKMLKKDNSNFRWFCQ